MRFIRLLRLSRIPFVALLAAELALVGVVGTFAWLALHPRPPAASPAPARSGAGPPFGRPRTGWLGAIPTPPSSPSGRASTGPLPGLGTDPAFVGAQLNAANRAEAALERDQWSATQLLTAGVRAYLEREVLPAVERARASPS